MDALKILMVDDEARMRKLVKDFLPNKMQTVPHSLLYSVPAFFQYALQPVP